MKVKQILEVKGLWALACAHDGIDPKAVFVAMSDDNPYLEGYNRAVMALQETIREERRSEQ